MKAPEAPGAQQHSFTVIKGQGQNWTINPLGSPHQETHALRHRLEHIRAQGRNGDDGKHQGSQKRDDHGEGQGREHFPLHALQGHDGQKGQGDDQLSEEAGFPHLQDGVEHRAAEILPRLHLPQVMHNVFHLDDGAVHDHADGNSRPRGRKDRGQIHLPHGDESGQGHQRQS